MKTYQKMIILLTLPVLVVAEMTPYKIKSLEKKYCNQEEMMEFAKDRKKYLPVLTNLLKSGQYAIKVKDFNVQYAKCEIKNLKNGWTRLIQDIQLVSNKQKVFFQNQETSEIDPTGKTVKYSPSKPINIQKPTIPSMASSIPVKFTLKDGLKKGESLNIYQVSKEKTRKLVFKLDSNFDNKITSFMSSFRVFKPSNFVLERVENNKLISSQDFQLSVVLAYESPSLVQGKGNALKTYKMKLKKNKFKTTFDNDMKSKTRIKSITYKSNEGQLVLQSTILVSSPIFRFIFENELKDKSMKVHVKLINEKD